MKKIAYITDIHLDEAFTLESGVDARKNWQTILSDVRKRGITEVIFGGDIGEKDSNAWFFETLKDFNLNITLGNHDTFEEAVKHFNPGIPEDQLGMYYAVEGDYFKFIFLDTSTAEVSDPQFDWMKRALVTDQKILLFSHHPILQTGTTPQSMFPWNGGDRIRKELLKVENEVTVFCAHLHIDDKTIESQATQYITPSASMQIKKHSEKTEIAGVDYGYRIITLGEGTIESEVVMFGS